MTGFFEESQDGEGKVRQCGKNFAQTGTTQIVTVFVPPSVFDEVQGVFDLPVVTHQFLKIGRPHLRRVDARDEVTRVVRKKCVRRIEHIAIHTQNDLTIRISSQMTQMPADFFYGWNGLICENLLYQRHPRAKNVVFLRDLYAS